jgi:23S rRNA U2552 (ribose-2'-O)-methylase RlmE/FtsJ
MEFKLQSFAWERKVPIAENHILAESPDLSANTIILPAVWVHAFSADELVLHAHRKRINEYERITGTSEWEYYKKIVNPYELIYTQKKYSNFPESVCLLHPLSRSYFKMTEILGLTEFFKGMNTQRKIRSAHVCEGPGGFIQGFIDQAERHRIQHVTSTAITLRPKQPNVPGWKRAAIFLQKHRNVKISYGQDGTGDLLKYENQNEFIRACDISVDLFTADGGFDFSMDYDAQEQTIFPLLLASVRVGFDVLKEGGLMIVKFFDMYYDGTRDLIYFLSQHFGKWILYKPATSRPCNPEIYFIGDIYRRPPTPILQILRGWSRAACFGDAPLRLFRDPYASSFTDYLNTVVQKSVANQIAYLEKVFALVESDDKEAQIKQMLQIHEVISYTWCSAFNVPVYSSRCQTIGASRTYLRAAGLLK